MKTWATLGGVKFELAAPETFSETVQWEYKEQETVADKAVIQFAGAKPSTLSIMARLHSSFCKPEARVQEFKDKAKKIAPLPLILANGRLVGFYVIEEIQSNYNQTVDTADVVSMELTLKLKEASGTALAGPPTAAQSKATTVKKTGGAAAKAAKPTTEQKLAAIRAEANKRIEKATQPNTIDKALRKT